MSAVTPRSIRIPVPQLELAALDYGPPAQAAAEAPPVLLVHGMRDLAWSMDSIAQALCGRHRVVALDLRGHGDSGHPGTYAIGHFHADLYYAIQHLGLERPILIGHSFGGEVVSQFAGIFPEIPSRCVLIEGLGPPPFEGEGLEKMRRTMARASVEALAEIDPKGRRVADLETAIERLRRTHTRLPEERARFLAQVGTRPHPDGGLRWKWDSMLRTMFGSFSREQMEERWTWVECPVLVIGGSVSASWWSRGPSGRFGKPTQKGYLPPAELDRRLGLLRDAHYVEIEDAGHMIHFDQPHALNEAIEAFVSPTREP